MRVVKNPVSIEIKVAKEDLFNKRYLTLELLSAYIREIEKEKGLCYKELLNKMYNSVHYGKYNIKRNFGCKFIDTKNPMKEGVKASLVLSFKEV